MSIATPTAKTKPKPLIPMTPDFCLACDATDGPFPVAMKPQEQLYRGETFWVPAPMHVCPHCAYEMPAKGYLTAVCRGTNDAYRRNHGLLTSVEIIERRKAMKKSQRQFADFVGVSIASLKRWETGFLVQDKASDELLRMKTDHVCFIDGTSLTMYPQVEDIIETWETTFLMTSDIDPNAANSNELTLAA